jgi:hypothetical protein
MTQGTEYPKGSGNYIHEKYKMQNGDIYIITRDKTLKWKLFLENKKIGESMDHEKIYEKIPDNR